MRVAFRPIEPLVEKHLWEGQVPGDRVVTFTVVGYAEDFRAYECLELAIEFDTQRDGLKYISPFRHDLEFLQPFRLGEDEGVVRALEGLDPEASRFRRLHKEVLPSIAADSPQLPIPLQDIVANAVALIKTEAYYNKQKVGRMVNAIVIDRAKKQAFGGQF
jgi:hypothetical protein